MWTRPISDIITPNRGVSLTTMTKYQVFISSTYKDLQVERAQVLKATLDMGHIPVGMEMFSAADEEQWKIITRHIDASDYYVVIVAHCYGSVVDGTSYTEKEYNYARSKNIPVLGFIIEDNAEWPKEHIDTDPEKTSSLQTFKATIKEKPVDFWSSASELYGKFAIALMKQITSTPRPGWKRATNVVGPDVINELSRLSSENAELREQLQVAHAITKHTRTTITQETTLRYPADSRELYTGVKYE